MSDVERDDQPSQRLTDARQSAGFSRFVAVVEGLLLLALFFVYAGDLPPKVNEAHYLVKAKNYWDPQWCQQDLFASSGKAHTTFYFLFGWPTLWVSLSTTAWIGRAVGWAMLAFGLQRLCWVMFRRRFVSLIAATIWIAGIEYGNLAGEWVVGGIEAKVPAYGLILLALSFLVQRRWNWVWVLLGMAAAFHVLSGGWAVIAASITWLRTEWRQPDGKPWWTPGLVVGGFIALLGVVPAVALTFGATPADATAAARIYSYYRIRHHLLPADFFLSWYVRHGVLIVITAGLALWQWSQPPIQRLGWFAVGSTSIAVIGLAVGVLPALAPDLAAKLLRYYWFRLTDATVPLMLGAVAASMWVDVDAARRRVATLLLLVAVALVGYSAFRRVRLGVPPSVSNDLLGRDAGASPAVQQKLHRDWMAVCRWASASTAMDAVFLTPRHQQTFKWYAGRAEVVNWKDVPQDAASLRQWYRRFHDVFPRHLGHVRVTIRYDKLREYREQYGASFLIVDQRVTGPNLPLVRVFPQAWEVPSSTDTTYAVYELPLARR